MSDLNHMRTQQLSSGELRTWRWPSSLGEGYFGDEVVYTVTKVKLSESRRADLLASEERVRAMDKEIHQELKDCWVSKATFFAPNKGV